MALCASLLAAAVGFSAFATQTLAADAFAPGWTLAPEASRLTFQSVKNQSVVETSKFATFAGEIAADGAATVTIELESVDTGIDLRNVRMRFLFFETFKFPQATISLDLTQEMLAGLAETRRMQLPLDFTIDLHGVQQKMQADVIVTLFTDTQVSVASAAPIAISAEAFDLTEGVLKLQDAAKVKITPVGSVSFDMVFRRNTTGEGARSTAQQATAAPAKSAALDAEGDFSREACIGRFEILSRAGSIYFQSGSANLSPKSAGILEEVLDIVQRCRDLRIQVAGHTDSIGAAAANQRLSEARAKSVAEYLTDNGVDPARVTAIGYGEVRPVADNDTARGRRLNRRIEFSPQD